MRETLTPKMLTQISRDWGELFPSLQRRVKGCFNRLVGPLRIVVWFDQDSDKTRYRPKVSVGSILNERDYKGATISVEPNDFHHTYISLKGHLGGKYRLAAQELRDKCPLSIEGDIFLSQVLEAYIWELSPERKGGGGFRMCVIEEPPLLCGWLGRTDLAIKMLDWGRGHYEAFYERYKIWAKECETNPPSPGDPIPDLSRHNVPLWYETMMDKAHQQKWLDDLFEREKIRLKMDKLPYSDIIVDI
jgi:hypothetical protein